MTDDSWKYKIKNLEYDAYYSGDYSRCGVSYPYSKHNRFRETLIKIIDRLDLLNDHGEIIWSKLVTETDLPFYDLINFSDCEGCLDWSISEILYHDFIEYKDKAIEYLNNNYYSTLYYLEWLEVFDKGRIINSVVVFH